MDKFYFAVCRAVFWIPFLDLVKWSLGYNTLFVGSLFSVVRDVRDKLRRAILDVPGTIEVYLKSKK